MWQAEFLEKQKRIQACRYIYIQDIDVLYIMYTISYICIYIYIISHI